MNTEVRRGGPESIADFLFEIRSKGVKVWGQDGQLRYQAKKGILSPEETESLRRRKSEIVAFLQGGVVSGIRELRLGPRQTSGPVRATSNQQWRLKTLYPLYSARPVYPTRLSGRLDTQIMRQAFTDLAQRHESLRVHFLKIESEIWQCTRLHPGEILSIVDLTWIPTDRRMKEVTQIVDQLSREKIDLATSTGPLFSGTLLKVDETEHVLLIHCYDCITDATSTSILWRDLWTMYFESAANAPSSLPTIPVQHPDFADWLHKSDPPWHIRHAPYWSDRLSGSSRIRLFPQGQIPSGFVNCMKILPFRLGQEVTAGLRALSRKQRTSLGMIVLTVWTAMMLRWSDSTDIVVAFLTSGRMYPEIQNSIGCFMSPLYLRINTGAATRFLDLIPQVSQEYGTAIEHHDFGRLLLQASKMPSIGNPLLNWLPREVFPDSASVFQLTRSRTLSGELKILPFEFESPPRCDVAWDFEPSLALIETETEILGRYHYRADLYSTSSIQRLAETVQRFVISVQTDPTIFISSLSCTCT